MIQNDWLIDSQTDGFMIACDCFNSRLNEQTKTTKERTNAMNRSEKSINGRLHDFFECVNNAIIIITSLFYLNG